MKLTLFSYCPVCFDLFECDFSIRYVLKWFLEKLGHEGLNNLLMAYPDKSAYAQCIVAYCEGPGHEIKVRERRERKVLRGR